MDDAGMSDAVMNDTTVGSTRGKTGRSRSGYGGRQPSARAIWLTMERLMSMPSI